MTDIIDREQKTVSFERTLSASPEEVFDAWTQPEEISQWWDPTGAPLVSCTIDLKPQGAFRFVTAGHAPPFEGVYAVVDRPRRLEFHALGAKGTVALRRHERGTQMNVSIQCASAEHFEMFVKLGVHTGTSRTLDNLVELLDGRRKTARGA
ncbi:SRPBCC domain-containing protein [Aggregicoccus sp. 17bor-14]|uniref:SRPBCC family protein n=1 Tax=Myxococcaceae TaxID=31 RepID=UPI00129C7FB8|nr:MULTISPECIES: SRPBCC domain-containing protein [Myxococcaceae]MBF5041998.1 SRPBCC domain-containing protein [Simulacricoccus sp. 17bor-14]MRI87778.1 SRPBCC domain-containing protein [Aggregicoccus sp. 17bor-14]